jgi:uncharacterized protein GlcG (DUF336 family)
MVRNVRVTIAAVLNLETARKLIDAGEEAAHERGLELSFAIVDAGGHIG